MSKGKLIPLENNYYHWKHLKNLLLSSKYCGICLEITEDLCRVEAKHYIAGSEDNEFSLKDILFTLFENTIQNILFSGYICNTCKVSAINAYIFIFNTKENAEIYKQLIYQMDSKIEQVLDHCVNNEHENKVQNALIVLDEPESAHLVETSLSNQLKKLSNAQIINDDDLMNDNHKITNTALKSSLTFTKIQQSITKLSKKNYDNTINFTRRKNIGNYACNQCPRRFVTKRYLKQHKIRMHLRTVTDYSCSVCHKEFLDKPDLHLHLATHHSGETHRCRLCSVEFQTRALYLQHTQSVMHRAHLQPEILEYMRPRYLDLTCSVCQLKFTHMKPFKEHLSKHKVDAKHQCFSCNLEFNTRLEYKTHIKTISHLRKCHPDKGLKCKYCNYRAYYARDLKNHLNNKHLKIQFFECFICNKKFPNSIILKTHVQRHSIMGTKIVEKSYERFCEVCGKKLCSTSAMKKHMRLHTGERPYPCDLCSEAFISASVRNIHKQRKHAERTIPCPLCDMKFYAMPNMRGHVKKVHWKSNEKFDYTKLEGITEADYALFEDRRKVDFGVTYTH